MDYLDIILYLAKTLYKPSDVDWENLFEKNVGVNRLTPEDLLIFKERLEKLPTNSKALCKVILDSPSEFIGLTKNALYDKLYHMLKIRKEETTNFKRKRWSTRSWTREMIWNCCKEIKKTLGEN